MDGQVERPLQLHIHLVTLYKRTHKNSVTVLLPNILLQTDKQINVHRQALTTLLIVGAP